MIRDDLFIRQDGRWGTFICRCSEEGDIEADELMTLVRDKLAGGGENLIPQPVNDRNFLTMVVCSLWWDFGASITGIDNDQWSMVSAETYGEEDKLRVRVQCDDVEDGIAAAWYAFWLRDHEADT